MRKINFYLAKNFLIRFFQISCGFSLLIFFINFIDSMDKTSDSANPIYLGVMLAAMQVPSFLNDVVSSLVLIATIVTFFTLSSRSEITIMRISGFSLWQIIRPIALSAVILGIFWITIFDLASIKMMKYFHHLEDRYVKNELREVSSPQGGIWLKQNNLEKRGEEIVFLAQKIYKDEVEFADVTIWFFNAQNEFYRKVDAKTLKLNKGNWSAKDAISNDAKALNQKIDQLIIPTDLEADFVTQKIINNFQDVKIFSIFELPNLIKDLASSGFSPIKFRIYFHSLLCKPILFAAMSMIACYFSLNHIRNQNTVFLILCGIVIGLVLYITSSIINALGSSSIIPVFAATWMITIIWLAIGVLLIYRKESF